METEKVGVGEVLLDGRVPDVSVVEVEEEYKDGLAGGCVTFFG